MLGKAQVVPSAALITSGQIIPQNLQPVCRQLPRRRGELTAPVRVGINEGQPLESGVLSVGEVGGRLGLRGYVKYFCPDRKF